MSLSLGEKQELFVVLQAEWVLDLLDAHPTWRLRDGEGRILQNGAQGKGRKAKKLGITMLVSDAVHIEGSAHYNGIGKDWNLFVNGTLITSGDHPAWIEAGEAWEAKHELCRWGGRFGDGNHTSLFHLGKS